MYPKVNSRASITQIFFLVFVPYITILLPLYPARDMASSVAALSNPGRREPRPFLNYFLWEYIGPSIIFFGITGITFGYKSYYSLLVHRGFVPAGDAIFNLPLIAFIAAVWMWFDCQRQARLDLPLGETTRREGKTLSTPLMLLVLLGIGLAAGFAVGTPLYSGGIERVTVFQSTVIHVVVWLTCGVMGCYLVLLWGRARGGYTPDSGIIQRRYPGETRVL
ncbi:MAG: hypothetical protein MUO75_03200 [Actinobacteria bacterium]|nr:hypothetical protein [Actinomycetota bacterium]